MADQDQRHLDRKAEEDKQAFIIASVAASNAEAAKDSQAPAELILPAPISVESSPAPIADKAPAKRVRRARKAK